MENVKEKSDNSLIENFNKKDFDCDDIVLKAKGVLFNVYDKITSLQLSPQPSEYPRDCQKTLRWNDEVWNVPHPKYKQKFEFTIRPQSNSLILEVPPNNKHEPSSKILLKKYFSKWRNNVKHNQQYKLLIENRAKETAKLDKLIQNLVNTKTTINKIEKCKTKRTMVVNEDNFAYKNRYKAQKDIIDKQKQQIQEQNRIIQDLKQGIIKDELLKSMDKTKIDIHEIFRSCSIRVKSNMPYLQSTDEREQIMINSQKAPKIVLEMEKRAKEREIKREIILERRRLLDIQKQKIMEEIIEKKRVAEEDERRRNLEMIEEKRRKDMELFMMRKLNKEKYMEKMNMATEFYKRQLLKKYFKRFSEYFQNMQTNLQFAKEFYKRKIKRRILFYWNIIVEQKYKLKIDIAETIYEYSLMKRVVRKWHKLCVEIKLNMQTADDYFDMQLTIKVLTNWRKYTYWQNHLRQQKMLTAIQHSTRKMLFQYFYQWKSLPAVIQLEKAKEMKKIRWRAKVLEILPDYKPPEF